MESKKPEIGNFKGYHSQWKFFSVHFERKKSKPVTQIYKGRQGFGCSLWNHFAEEILALAATKPVMWKNFIWTSLEQTS